MCLGIQPHPEFTLDYEHALLQIKEERVDQKIMGAALESLNKKTENAIVAQWIVDYYNI